MQGDGNLVLYTAAYVAVRNSGTGGTGGSNHLILQSDSNLVVYTPSGSAV